ncbi:hypothetical protein [Streptomyces sp. 1222.5]
MDRFESRLFEEGQQVYARMEDGVVADVEAALMDAHLKASDAEEGQS